MLSSLLGLDSAHNAGVAQTNSTNQLALQNQYGSQGANIYAGLAQQGGQQAGAYGSNYLNLLNQFGGLAGLGGNTIPGQGGPGSQNPGTPQNNAPAGTNGVPQNQGGPQDPKNPYSLDPNQQGLLNQSLASLGKQQQQATASFQQQLSAKGINDPRALQVGQEAIQEHFSALQQTTQAQFYEQVKQDKLKALQDIISGLGQYGQQGIQQEESAASGYLGLSSGAQAAANQQQNQANQQQQLANNQFGGLLNLIGFGVGGGFGGAGTPATVSSGVAASASANGGVGIGQEPFSNI